MNFQKITPQLEHIKRHAPLRSPCPLSLSASVPIPKTVDNIITQRRNELMLRNSRSALTTGPDGARTTLGSNLSQVLTCGMDG